GRFMFYHDVGGGWGDDEFDWQESMRHLGHAARHATGGMVEVKALAALQLVFDAVGKDFLVLRNERRLLPEARAFRLVERRRWRDAWDVDAHPGAAPVRIFGDVLRMHAGAFDAQRCRQRDGGKEGSIKHDHFPLAKQQSPL